MKKIGSVTAEMKTAFMYGYNSVDERVVIASCNKTKVKSSDFKTYTDEPIIDGEVS